MHQRGSETWTLSEDLSPTAHRPDRSATNHPSPSRNGSITGTPGTASSFNRKSNTSSLSRNRADLTCSRDRPWVGNTRSSPPHDVSTSSAKTTTTTPARDNCGNGDGGGQVTIGQQPCVDSGSSMFRICLTLRSCRGAPPGRGPSLLTPGRPCITLSKITDRLPRPPQDGSLPLVFGEPKAIGTPGRILSGRNGHQVGPEKGIGLLEGQQ